MVRSWINILTCAVVTISVISIITGTVVRSYSICAVSIWIAVMGSIFTFIDILNKIKVTRTYNSKLSGCLNVIKIFANVISFTWAVKSIPTKSMVTGAIVWSFCIMTGCVVLAFMLSLTLVNILNTRDNDFRNFKNPSNYLNVCRCLAIILNQL